MSVGIVVDRGGVAVPVVVGVVFITTSMIRQRLLKDIQERNYIEFTLIIPTNLLKNRINLYRVKDCELFFCLQFICYRMP